jgi:Tfp pilus assembly protein PilF
MRDADQRFIDDALKTGLTRAEASDKSVQLGWQYFQQRRDIATAMKRFNQAWLLDPGNGDAFHGFAVLTMQRDRNASAAEALFRQGIAAARQSPGIWLDYGRFLVMTRKPAEAVAPLRQALTFPGMGPDAEALLTLALAQSGDHAAACIEKDKVEDGAQTVIRDAARAIACPP